MIGGGDNVYVVDDAGDSVVENGSEGGLGLRALAANRAGGKRG